MNKIFLLTSIILIFTLTGCSNDASKSTDESNSLTIDGENITLTFTDEFEEYGTTVNFGPKGLVPESPTDQNLEEFYYSLRLIDKRSADEITQEISEIDQRLITLEPTEIKIGNSVGLKWAIGGMCEKRIIELFGNQNNIQFYSSGCHTLNKEIDFAYFENLFDEPSSATKEFPKGIPASADDPGPPGGIHNLPKGCFVMKKINADEYDCFGCANGNCKDEDLRIWDYTDQDAAGIKGFSCLETNDGCKISSQYDYL